MWSSSSMQPYPPSPTGGNPFDDGNTNPFLTPPAKTKSAQEQEVEIILTSQEGQSTGTVFGSPVSAGSSASPKASVGAHSDTATRHATPSNVRNPAIAGPVAISPPRGGAWKTPPSAGPQVRAFETTAPPPTSTKAGFPMPWIQPAVAPATTSTSVKDSIKLSQKEQELKRREENVAGRESALRAGTPVGANKKNWPRCWPLFHHDIAGDIAYDRQSLVKWHYITWMIVVAGYLWNFICITIFFIAGEKGVDLWLFSGLIAFGGLPLSFLCWYIPLYSACRTDSGARWGWYFLNMLANIVWCWWMFVGVRPKIGGYSAGLFTMIQQFSHGGGEGNAFGALCIVNMVIFGLGGALSMILMGRSYREFRNKPQVVSSRRWSRVV